MVAEHIKHWRIGDVTVTRLVEVNAYPDDLAFLLKEGSPELLRKYDWLRPHFATPEGKMLISFQAFLVRIGDRCIMVDTCIGNGKWRQYEVFNRMQSTFLDDLASVGCAPEQVDTVLCTHLHFDHVGWNTRRVNDQWVPTFPNARYLFGRREWEHWQTVPRDGGVHAEHLVDSIQPIVDAGLADFIDPDFEVANEIRLEPTPGHTHGHVSVHIRSQGREAVITGDIMHHPIQIAEPDMLDNFSLDAGLAARTRRAYLERYQDRKVLFIGTHFADPTAGWIERAERNWRFAID